MMMRKSSTGGFVNLLFFCSDNTCSCFWSMVLGWDGGLLVVHPLLSGKAV
jgi:hypothetical protein